MVWTVGDNIWDTDLNIDIDEDVEDISEFDDDENYYYRLGINEVFDNGN